MTEDDNSKCFCQYMHLIYEYVTDIITERSQRCIFKIGFKKSNKNMMTTLKILGKYDGNGTRKL